MCQLVQGSTFSPCPSADMWCQASLKHPCHPPPPPLSLMSLDTNWVNVLTGLLLCWCKWKALDFQLSHRGLLLSQTLYRGGAHVQWNTCSACTDFHSDWAIIKLYGFFNETQRPKSCMLLAQRTEC